VRECYADFGSTLAAEYFRGEGFDLSKETLRLADRGRTVEGGQGAPPALASTAAASPPRGEMVQTDGSPHDWFEGRGPRWTLIAFIDDAISQVMHAHFAPV